MHRPVNPYVDDPDFTLYVGDVSDALRELPAESVHCVVTSPPYWGLRDYGTGSWDGGDPDCDHAKGNPRQPHERRASTLDGGTDTIRIQEEANVYRDVCGRCGARRVDRQLGLEATPDEYIARMVEVFREVRRVLRNDGTLWLNIGSSYMANPSGSLEGSTLTKGGKQTTASREARRGAASRGTSYTAPQGSPATDSACLDLCGECAADLSRRNPSTPPLPPGAAALDVPTGPDSARQGSSPSTGQHAAPASTTPGSSPQPPAACWRCGTRPASVALRVEPTSSPDAPASSHTVAYTHDSEQPASESRTQGTDASGTAWVNYTSKLKQKDMVPTPWMLAMALQEDGWYLRADIIWSKPNPMPESVTDRPTKSHEYLFLLSKRPRYFYDQEAIREPAEWARWGDQTNAKHEGSGSAAGWIGSRPKSELTPARRKPLIPEQTKHGVGTQGIGSSTFGHWADERGRNRRSVWEIPTEPYPEAHFATFPQALVEPCVKAGTSERGCCPECGAPWERETSVSYDNPGNRSTNGPRSVDAREKATHATVNSRGSRLERRTETLGWEPSCDHGREPVSCVVLDPFMGSGTTALVARRLGRKSVGVELNPEYAAMCAKRLSQLSLLAEENVA